MKKLFLLCLTIVTINFAGFSQTATAPAGGGTEADPYVIASLENLYWISVNQSAWSSFFIQSADIDAAVTQTWNSGEGWGPIGNSSVKFTGSYNGKGYVTQLETYTLLSTVGLSEPWDFQGTSNNDWMTDDLWHMDTALHHGQPFLSWQQFFAVLTIGADNITETTATISGSFNMWNYPHVLNHGLCRNNLELRDLPPSVYLLKITDSEDRVATVRIATQD